MNRERRILYLAASHSLSQTRRMVMEHAGYTVTLVHSAAEAKPAIQQQVFEIAVIGSRVPAAEENAFLEAIDGCAKRPMLVALDNRSQLNVDYTLPPVAGAEELLAVLGEALIRSHGHH